MCSQRTSNQSRVPINHGATTVTSSISTKRWNEARSINDVRGSMVTEGREYWACIETYLVIIVILLLSSCDADSHGAKDVPISSPIGCKVARHLRIPLHKRASVTAMARERWGHSRGHEPHESSTEETRPTIDVRGFKSARKSISSGSAPSIVWFAIRRRQGLRDTNTEQQDRAAGPSSQEREEG